MKKGVRNSTLQKKCNRWARELRLSDWTITCKYATISSMNDEDTVGRLEECRIPEKIAQILIRRNYFDGEGFGISYNIDTLIIHELIHIIEKVGKQNSNITEKIEARKDFSKFEEYNCDTFAAILYFVYYDRI